MDDISIRYQKALKEVYIIINNLTEDLYIKIPITLKKTIKENMDKNYKISLEELKNNGKMQETIDIVSLIYRDYLCDKELKEKLIEKDEKNLNDRYFNMFKNKKIEIPKITDLVVIKEKWYVKILKKISKLLTKNRI